MISGYQALLLRGLNLYLLSKDRKSDIFGQNKEGIFRIFGEDLLVVWVFLIACPSLFLLYTFLLGNIVNINILP